MLELGLQAFLVTSLAHIRYLFGFTGSNALALIDAERAVLVTDRRYTQQAKDEVTNAEVVVAPHDLFSEIKEKKLVPPGRKLGFEAAHLSVKYYTQLRKKLPEVKLVASEQVVEHLASVKDPAEVESVRRAGAICTRVFDALLAMVSPGVSELDLSAELSYRTRKLGSERDPFEPIVASGARSALPHGVSSRKTLEPGDLVIVDFGATVNGYAADFTRTLVVGEPGPKQREMAALVREALAVAEERVRPGMRGKELDQVARDFLTERGYGAFFQHSLGHGLGLEVHGLPRIGERSNDVLQVGNVITLEPGVYLPEIGGVRIEDDFVITEAGVENLTPYSRELVCVA